MAAAMTAPETCFCENICEVWTICAHTVVSSQHCEYTGCGTGIYVLESKVGWCPECDAFFANRLMEKNIDPRCRNGSQFILNYWAFKAASDWDECVDPERMNFNDLLTVDDLLTSDPLSPGEKCFTCRMASKSYMKSLDFLGNMLLSENDEFEIEGETLKSMTEGYIMVTLRKAEDVDAELTPSFELLPPPMLPLPGSDE